MMTTRTTMTDSGTKISTADVSVEGRDDFGTSQSAELLCDNGEYPDRSHHQEDGLCWQKTDGRDSIST